MITTQEEHWQHAELTALAQRDLVGYDRAVQAVKDKRVNGIDYAYCFYGFYVNPEECTDRTTRSDQGLTFWCEFAISFPRRENALSPIEDACLCLSPGKELDKEEQAFLALCEQVRTEVVKSCSPVATGSEQ